MQHRRVNYVLKVKERGRYRLTAFVFIVNKRAVMTTADMLGSLQQLGAPKWKVSGASTLIEDIHLKMKKKKKARSLASAVGLTH